MSKENGKGRTRNFATVVYPDSAPEGWKNILTEQRVPALISPLHDKDVNDKGEDKKAHFHVIVMFDGVKTKEQAQELFEKIGGVGCEVVQSLRGYARYLCHMDNPEKAQYSQEDVCAYCGADYIGIIGLALDKYKAVREIITYCREQNIYSYARLLEYCMEERFDWFRLIVDHPVLVREYLKSRTWTDENDKNNLSQKL